jgi:hypothetical protein
VMTQLVMGREGGLEGGLLTVEAGSDDASGEGAGAGGGHHG